MSRPPPSNLAEVLPSNRTPFMVASAETDGNRTLSIDLPLRALFDPDICPPEMLDILAYTWSVDEWEPGGPVRQDTVALTNTPTRGAVHFAEAARAAGIKLIAAQLAVIAQDRSAK